MKRCHKDARLDRLLGSDVEVTFFDNSKATGTLRINIFKQDRYYLCTKDEPTIEFRKSHVKIIKRLKNGKEIRINR